MNRHKNNKKLKIKIFLLTDKLPLAYLVDSLETIFKGSLFGSAGQVLPVLVRNGDAFNIKVLTHFLIMISVFLFVLVLCSSLDLYL